MSHRHNKSQKKRTTKRQKTKIKFLYIKWIFWSAIISNTLFKVWTALTFQAIVCYCRELKEKRLHKERGLRQMSNWNQCLPERQSNDDAHVGKNKLKSMSAQRINPEEVFMCCVWNDGTGKRLFYMFQGPNVAICVSARFNAQLHRISKVYRWHYQRQDTSNWGGRLRSPSSPARRTYLHLKNNSRQLRGLRTLQRLCQNYVTFSSYAPCSGMCLFPPCFIFICPFPFIIYDIEKSSKNKGFH